MSKKSFIPDVEKFYEGDTSVKPKLDHLQFSEKFNDELSEEKSTEDVVEFLKEYELKISEPWPASRSGVKFPTKDQCNKMLLRIHKRFEHHRLIDVFNEIVEFFHLDYIKFFHELGTHIQEKLYAELNTTINLDSYKRINRKQQIAAGGFQPTLAQLKPSPSRIPSSSDELGSSDAGSSGT